MSSKAVLKIARCAVHLHECGVLVQETRCFDAVVELYAGLQEEDILAGLWKRKGAAEETRNALAAVQHGLLPRAQNVLTSAVHKMDSGGYSTSMSELHISWPACH